MFLYYVGDHSAGVEADGDPTDKKLIVKVCLKIRAVHLGRSVNYVYKKMICAIVRLNSCERSQAQDRKREKY